MHTKTDENETCDHTIELHPPTTKILHFMEKPSTTQKQHMTLASSDLFIKETLKLNVQLLHCCPPLQGPVGCCQHLFRLPPPLLYPDCPASTIHLFIFQLKRGKVISLERRVTATM